VVEVVLETLVPAQVRRVVRVLAEGVDGFMSRIVETLQNMDELPGREFEKFSCPVFANILLGRKIYLEVLRSTGAVSLWERMGTTSPAVSWAQFAQRSRSTLSIKIVELTNAF
jgi:hypothetical protein